MYQITCTICQKIFDARIPHKKTCSPECRKKLAAQNGYNGYLRNLKNGITKVCEVCQVEYRVEVARAEESRFCSMKCTGIGKHYPNKKERVMVACLHCGKKIINPVDGARARKYCSRECNSLSQVGHARSDETREKIRQGHIGKHPSIETREKKSRIMSEKIVNGEYACSFKKGKHFSPKTNSEFACRSSWEKIAMELLDQDETVKTYVYEPFAVPYLFEGVQKNYIPDILITYENGTKTLVEVKPKAFVDHGINQAKFAAARNLCVLLDISFEVWTEDILVI